MAVQVSIEHATRYKFDRLVGLGPHVIRLRPAPHCRTPINSYSLRIAPEPHFINWQQDAYGNHLARVVFPDRTTELSITVDLVADLTVINPFDFFVEQYAETFPFDYPPGVAADLEPYRRTVTEPAESAPPGAGALYDAGSATPGPLLQAWLAEITTEGPIRTVQFLADVNRKASQSVAYTVRMEAGVHSPDETLRRGSGSCRDSGWLLVAALRELGFAARFVSGYLVQLAADDPGKGGPTADFTDLHAWAEVYLPGAGWIGLDATSGLFAGEGHIPLSATPKPAESAPVTGLVDPCQTTMQFHNAVHRFREDPRTTLPYTPEQWSEVMALGERVDGLLTRADVRLTIGGEPTFVSATDSDSPQWSVAADGADKRAMAMRLAARLKEHYAPRGVVHHGQGKWYPGEPLPRWQIGITWRADGKILWQNPALLGDPWTHPPVPATAAQAATAARSLATRLGIAAEFVLPAYEDHLARLASEARLPAGEPPRLDPPPGTPATADKRAELLETLDAASTEPTGWVLPLHRREDDAGWATARWQFRRGRLVLIPGTSAAGLRLPLDAIAWTPPPGRPERGAPFVVTDALPTPSYRAPDPGSVTAVEDAPTTALAVEVRDGNLYVFLPPLDDFGHAAELLAAIERVVGEVGVPVILEGYPLPVDPRTRTLTVTPDPGVIEVNVHPAASWGELVEITTSIDAAARACGLATEKFAIDGTHTGTGGGSHITLGGSTPADSPLLRRPSLLVSLLTYWQHHPALSYLFSGRFIGPTSQAPRVDEARHEYLYELEIAFGEIDRMSEDDGGARPWLVDRALRHLLTDVTGNTHRAEFCIDKLYSPDSSRGRLGLLELRGFEMPPHPQMSLIQALLIRSLVARFWNEPYRSPLKRWGTALHDRFLLPAFAAADIADVVDDLRAHGIAFEQQWLAPFVEFRFPRLGSVTVGPVTLELRSAIEPWHVLGEEASGGGTARYVDSSLERVQVQVGGITPGRHIVTCNGVPVPLHPNGSGDSAVAGVRFRAWAPPSALHPTIAIHSPLIFDVVDAWNGRSLGGCTYHVVHPGGRAYKTFPVNSNEAEARRAGRFVADGHTPGPMTVVPVEPNADYPYTLDLRRARSTR
ncbi:MAG: transglutaminase family protein [Actinomycetota bacterium]|nr:transglutaminase family protein [Actinomycetota bacterium]